MYASNDGSSASLLNRGESARKVPSRPSVTTMVEGDISLGSQCCGAAQMLHLLCLCCVTAISASSCVIAAEFWCERRICNFGCLPLWAVVARLVGCLCWLVVLPVACGQTRSTSLVALLPLHSLTLFQPTPSANFSTEYAYHTTPPPVLTLSSSRTLPFSLLCTSQERSQLSSFLPPWQHRETLSTPFCLLRRLGATLLPFQHGRIRCSHGQ